MSFYVQRAGEVIGLGIENGLKEIAKAIHGVQCVHEWGEPEYYSNFGAYTQRCKKCNLIQKIA